MGKITSIYLTDEEAAELKRFCEENQCTQYSALKTAMRELVSRHLNEIEKPEDGIHAEESSIPEEEGKTPQFKAIEEPDETKQKEYDLWSSLLRELESESQ